ncbi:hypothetical protein KJY73_17830 [Bowmanella sp. Y26]|uniref:hypothetical protein n=1 Tax=Bowmanella yangjiangensis TaxID=2811230 RepID=UPI001BDCDF9A|nr:hypothetical protein [Bowmanella yangjiangensis]MBT1065452.1 hypothetical protein [Bowmanella yangjiangensis]
MKAATIFWLIIGFLSYFFTAPIGLFCIFILSTFAALVTVGTIIEEYSEELGLSQVLIYFFFINQWLGYKGNQYLGWLFLAGSLALIIKSIYSFSYISDTDNTRISSASQGVVKALLILATCAVFLYVVNEKSIKRMTDTFSLSETKQKMLIAEHRKFVSLINYIPAQAVEIAESFVSEIRAEVVAASGQNKNDVTALQRCAKSDLKNLGSYSIPSGTAVPKFVRYVFLTEKEKNIQKSIYNKVKTTKGSDKANMQAAAYAFSQEHYKVALYFMDKSRELDEMPELNSAFYYFYALSALRASETIRMKEDKANWLKRAESFASYYLTLEGKCGRYSSDAKKIIDGVAL